MVLRFYPFVAPALLLAGCSGSPGSESGPAAAFQVDIVVHPAHAKLDFMHSADETAAFVSSEGHIATLSLPEPTDETQMAVSQDGDGPQVRVSYVLLTLEDGSRFARLKVEVWDSHEGEHVLVGATAGAINVDHGGPAVLRGVVTHASGSPFVVVVTPAR
jgi:hypothetical protein